MNNAALVKRRDSRDVTGRTRAIPLTAKIAIRLLLDDPSHDLQRAAAANGVTSEWLRKCLRRPEVQRYWAEEKKLAYAVAATGNPAALKDVRDNSRNAVARVNAARALDLATREMDESASLPRRQSPGVTIIIEAPDGGKAQVIGPPVIEHDPAAADLYGES